MFPGTTNLVWTQPTLQQPSSPFVFSPTTAPQLPTLAPQSANPANPFEYRPMNRPTTLDELANPPAFAWDRRTDGTSPFEAPQVIGGNRALMRQYPTGSIWPGNSTSPLADPRLAPKPPALWFGVPTMPLVRRSFVRLHNERCRVEAQC